MKVLLFIISCSIMFTSNVAYSYPEGYVQLPYFLKYGIALLWFIFSFFKTIFRNNMKMYKSDIKEFKIFIFPVILMILSLVISIFTNSEMQGDFIYRSVSNILCYLSIILCAYASINEFGFECIRYSYIGIIVTVFINLAYTIYLYGFFNVIKAIFNVFSIVGFKYESGTLMSNIGYSLEISEATFALGFFLIYMLLFNEKKVFKKIDIVLCIFGLYIGLKRVQIIAILFSIVIYKVFINKRSSIKKVRNYFFAAMLLFSFLYLYLIKYFTRIFIVFDVFRVRLYQTLKDMYSISPLFLGKGFGFVNMWLETIGKNEWLLSVSHSDITRLYIEFGFILFIVWLYYYCIKLPTYASKLAGKKVALIIMCFISYIIVTYFIDNTMTLFAVQYCFILIPMAERKGYVKHKRLIIRGL